jgi:hypothetical protein
MSGSVTPDINTLRFNLSAPFDAHTFYSGLRSIGADPLVAQMPDGSLGEYAMIGANNGVGDTRALYAWAVSGDPDGSLRSQYARSIWKSRPAGDSCTELQWAPLGF